MAAQQTSQAEVIRRARRELGFDLPVLRVEPLGAGRYRLHLYGGRSVEWQDPQARATAPAPAPRRVKPPAARKRKEAP